MNDRLGVMRSTWTTNAALIATQCLQCWAIAVLTLATGCGTTRMTDTQRTATEQLLISNAVDQTVSQLDLRFLSGKTVFLDAQFLDSVTDRGYLVSSLRQQLLACGCILQEERTKAIYIVEVRSGGAGTDRHSLLIGVPQMSVPTFVPGQPSQIPEIPFAKKTDQQGVSKIAVFAYNRVTGQRVWQSGIVEAISSARDVWVLGAGPFRKGTILQGTEFAGEQLPLPDLGERSEHGADARSRIVPVTAAVLWSEPPVARESWSSLLMPVPGRGLTPVVNVLVQSALSGPPSPRDRIGDSASVGTGEGGSAKKENAGPTPAANNAGSKPGLPGNPGGQAETEAPRGLSSGWGFRPDS